jgi:hypothetical protein
MNKKLLASLLLLVALIGIGVLLVLKDPAPKPIQLDHPVKTYSSSEYGLIFLYPQNYFVVEHDDATGGIPHHAVVLYEDTKTAHDIIDGKMPATEAPPAITVDIYDNAAGIATEKWIRDTQESNFKLSPDGVLTPVTLGGKPALSYTWSGLYEGRTIALVQKKRLYAFSVGMHAPGDRIVSDFSVVVNSATFTK